MSFTPNREDAAERERRRSNEIIERLNKKAGKKCLRLHIRIPLDKILEWIRRRL